MFPKNFSNFQNTFFVLEYDFTVSDINFKITDVGGEREERTQWIDFLAVKNLFPIHFPK